MAELIRKYRTGIVLALVFAISIGIGAFRFLPKNETIAYQPIIGPIEQIVHATGNISPAGTLDVYTSANGVISELYVQNGQTIEADTPLFKITSTATPQEKEAAQADYLAAIDAYNIAEQNKILYQAQLEQARSTVLGEADDLDDLTNRTDNPDDVDKDLAFSADWSARKLFDNAEKKYLDAQQTLQAKSQNISAKKAALDATKDQTITSPVAGTVANINPGTGDEVFIVTSTKSQPVLTLSNFETYTVELNVSEKNIYRVALGQSAKVQIESFPDTEFWGVVSKVDTIGEIDDGVVTYSVTIDLDQSDIRMRAGMTADVFITTDTRDNALLIPNAAISETELGKVVYVMNGSQDEYEERVITIGLKNDTYTEVLSGLDATETILDPLSITSTE